MNIKRLPVSLAFGCLAAATLACSLGDILFPKTFYVTKTDDTADGECSVEDCSLREAVIASNETTGHNEIVVPAGTFVLTITGTHFTDDGPDALGEIGDLDLTDGVDIQGAGWSTVIEGGVEDALRFRAFEVYAGMRVEIRDLGIRDMHSELGPGGGGIMNKGELTLAHVFFDQNGAYYGGGIYNDFSGVLTVTGSDLERNSAARGGGIYSKGTLSVQDSVLNYNHADYGGAIYIDQEASGRTATLSNVTMSVNEAQYGGGIYNDGMLTGDGLVLTLNSACNGGGLSNIFGTAVITDSLIEHNDATEGEGDECGVGGGITNVGTLTLERSAVNGNTANNVAGINSSVDLTLVNVTLSNNASTDLGATSSNWGALGLSGLANITNVTITSNGGSNGTGIHNNGGTVNIRNTIIDNPGVDCSGTAMNSLGHNLDSENTCGFSSAGDLINTDPLLGPLSGTGSSTLYPLLVGSPAIDTADSAGCPATDQRGAPRPFGPACDIGAYEFGAPAPQPRLVPSATSTSPNPTAQLTFTPTPSPSGTFTQPPRPTWTDTPIPSPTFTKKPKPQPTATSTPTTFILIVTLGPIKPPITATPTAIP